MLDCDMALLIQNSRDANYSATAIASTLELQRTGPGLESRSGEIDGVAVLAAIHLGVGSNLPLDVVAERVPTFEMPGAELALGVLLIACPLKRHARLDLRAGLNR